MNPTTYASHDDPNYNSKTAAGCEAAGEPCFTLRAQDMHAAETVRDWARRVIVSAGALNPDNGELVKRAAAIADAMDAWPVKKEPDL